VTRLFLGVDGGQSGTTALVGDDSGRVLGIGRGGPCNHVSAAESRAKFLDAIGGAVNAALREARATDATFAAACLGFSGGSADKEVLTREIVRAERYTITNDGLIAVMGATGGEPGVIAIAGTGSFAFGRNAEGRTARAGGWGYIFGDEGSGFDLARQALRAALREEEGWGPPTILRERLLAATGSASMNDLLHRAYTEEWPRARLATLAPLITAAADEDDDAAREIVGRCAQALATIATAVRNQLFTAGSPARVSYVGGVFRSTRVLERFRMLMEFELGNTVTAPVYGPAAGALLEAYRIAGVTCQLKNVPDEK
jgi:N-acetylglucosamine kinase-like BadF-type ATPase